MTRIERGETALAATSRGAQLGKILPPSLSSDLHKAKGGWGSYNPLMSASMRKNGESLLCLLGKQLEKHMSNMILERLEESNYELSRTQWGFRSNRSTTSALLSVTHDWHVTLEQGQEVCAIFFDYQKAFDSVPHRPLLSKLESLQLNYVIYLELA